MDAPGAILLLENGFAHCRVVIEQADGLLVALFLAGFSGSFSHCAAMCGPFVLCQVEMRLEAVPARNLSERQRLYSAVLLPYHLGRTVTYMTLGAVAGWFAGQFGALAGVRWLSVALLGLAAMGFLAAAGMKLAPRLPSGRRLSGDAVGSALARVARPLCGGAGPTGWRGLALGLTLGFLPCGLLYSAIAAAAATRDPVTGAVGLLAFAAGTVPTLVAVGIAGHAAGRKWQSAAARITPLILTCNAAFLGWLAWRLAIF